MRESLATVENGRLRTNSGATVHSGRPQLRRSIVWPRRDEVITQDMSDPNRNIIGYRSQEVPVANARTSGVFWSTSKTRDNRRFPGTTEKTLQRQGLESVSVAHSRGRGRRPSPVRPPEVGPR